MTIRFFILQTHYRSTLDFSNEALQASEKGLKRLWEAYDKLQALEGTADQASDAALENKVKGLIDGLDDIISDDFNTAKAMANLFELAPVINSIKDGLLPANTLSKGMIDRMKAEWKLYLIDIFGLREEKALGTDKLDEVLQLLIEIRRDARAKKDFMTSDRIRNQLLSIGIQLKDEKDGRVSWSYS
jgi:cysteinyl-tRNA synthetase